MVEKVDYGIRGAILKPGTVGGKHNDNSAGSKPAPSNGQRDIFSASNIIKPERNSDMTLYTTSKRLGSKVKSKEHGGVDVVIECVGCHNLQKNEEMQTQFGNFAESPTPRKTYQACHLVHAYPRLAQEENHGIDSQKQCCKCTYVMEMMLHNGVAMILPYEKFKDKSRIAKIIDLILIQRNQYITYLVAMAGFFSWMMRVNFLWPLEDSPKEAQKYSNYGDELAWFVENGVVHEYIRKPQYVLYILKQKWK
ncbi:hypothetical protein C1646_771919 [Rhizophagus diaphanus]|nr:hypothetical protein C1646_771919 [Rhizophagus diaphanus] [Rhizophagus sp. MUCL 43196]